MRSLLPPDATVYINIIAAVRTKGEVDGRESRRVGENPKIAPNRSEEGERTPRSSLAAAEAKQHLDIIGVSPLNVNPAGEIMLGDGRSH